MNAWDQFESAHAAHVDVADYEVEGGVGKRSKRFAMVIEDGVVKTLNVEVPGAFEVSSADAVLKAI